MILQSLNELYSRLSKDPTYEIASPGFCPQKISFRIVLRADGSLFTIEDARTPNEKSKLMPTSMQVPDGGGRTSGVKPNFLWDSQTYILGRRQPDKKEEYSEERHRAFKEKHLALRQTISAPAFEVLCQFLETWEPSRCSEFPLLDEVGTGFGVFQLQGESKHIHDDPDILNWWRANLPTDECTSVGQCLVSGEKARITRLHPSISGIAGANSTGASLVSFNARAYDSYGKEQSNNSPVSEEVAFRYGTALNSLLTGPNSQKHRLRIGDTTTVFWTETPTLVENCFIELVGGGSHQIDEVQDEQQRRLVERLLKAVRSGSNFVDFNDDLKTDFYILGLAPNAARLSVRFFHRSTVEDLLKQLHSHHRCFEIIPQFTEASGKRKPDPEFPAVWQILRETARVSDDIPPLLGGALARAILAGDRYPEALFFAILRRIHADRTINYLRAATLKAVLVRNQNQEIPIMLDINNPEPAYRLGRLFSALEKTQEDALGNLNAGIRDRFYSAASATPASVFPRLLRTYQHHLSKMTGGLKVNREQLIQEILDPIQEFPSQLNLKRQGLFAIGYYHQRKAFYTKKETATNPSTED